MSSLRAAATLAMFLPRRASMRCLSAEILAVGVALHRLDRRPTDRFGALFGDVSAVHDGVGLAVARGQPGPGAQLGGPGEAVHVTDLGDEHRRQHRSDTGYLLDGLIVAISVELCGDQRGEPGFMVIEDIDEFQQRAHPLGVGAAASGAFASRWRPVTPNRSD